MGVADRFARCRWGAAEAVAEAEAASPAWQ